MSTIGYNPLHSPFLGPQTTQRLGGSNLETMTPDTVVQLQQLLLSVLGPFLQNMMNGQPDGFTGPLPGIPGARRLPRSSRGRRLPPVFPEPAVTPVFPGPAVTVAVPNPRDLVRAVPSSRANRSAASTDSSVTSQTASPRAPSRRTVLAATVTATVTPGQAPTGPSIPASPVGRTDRTNPILRSTITAIRSEKRSRPTSTTVTYRRSNAAR